MTDCLTLLLQANFLTGVTCTFTNVIGLWFYAIFLAAIEIALYIEYENIIGVASLGLFSSIFLIAYLPPAFVTIPTFIFVINAAFMLYAVLKRM